MRYIDITKTVYPGMAKYPSDPDIEFEELKLLKRGDSCNLLRLNLGSHTGTHVDAPFHILKGGKGIDRIRVMDLISDVLVADLSIFFEKKMYDRIGRGNMRGVLFKSPKGIRGLDRRQAKMLIDRGAEIIGTESLSIEDSSDKSHPVHRLLLKRGIIIIEGLNLSRVRPGKYRLICLPLKIKGADGAPARAILEYD